MIFPKMAFLLGDAQKLPFNDNTVDFLVTSLSVHHWADAFIGISEIHRVLKPGGQLLIFDLRRDGWKGFLFRTQDRTSSFRTETHQTYQWSGGFILGELHHF